MVDTRERNQNILFYLALGLYLGVGVFLNLSYVFSLSGLQTVWRQIAYIVEIIIGLVGFAATWFLLAARAKVAKGSVERTILLLVGFTALFLALAGLSMGIIEKVAGDEAFTHSAFSLANIVPPIAFFLTTITGVTAIVILISNSHAILSRRQLTVTTIVSLILLVVLGAVFLTPITGIKLAGVMKIAAIFFSVICIFSLVGTSFAIMAFGRGQGRVYWRSLVAGLMLIALSGLAAFFCYAVGGKWVGLALLGFTTAEAFLGLAGYRRWKKLIQKP